MAQESKERRMEKALTRRPRLALLLLLGVGTLCPQTGSEALLPTLRERVDRYYAALEKREFESVWEFFDSTMRRDNPKDEYVKELAGTIRTVKLSGKPEIWLEGRDTKRTLGKAQAVITLTPIEGAVVPQAKHDTVWVLEKNHNGQGTSWFLVSSGMIRAESR